MSTAKDVEKGTELPPLSLRVTRADLVRYAGASGDFNPIHWSDRVAAGVGLPGVIAHGMLTMALAGRLVTQWAGDPAGGPQLRRALHPPRGGARRRRGRPRGDQRQGADVTDGVATVAITAVFDGKTVLGRAQAEVDLPG
jgi:hypothetical protein